MTLRGTGNVSRMPGSNSSKILLTTVPYGSRRSRIRMAIWCSCFNLHERLEPRKGLADVASANPLVGPSGQGLGLGVNEVIHHDEVLASSVTSPQLDITARDPHEEDVFASVESDPEQRKSPVALGGGHQTADKERAVDAQR